MPKQSAVAAFGFILLSLCSLTTLAHPHSHVRDLTDTFAHSLPGQWYHDSSHPLNNLFKRQNTAQPGTPEWAAQYPPAGQIPPDTIPAHWLDALHAAEEAGLIPDIPIPTESNFQNPVYPRNVNPAGPEICSSTWKCRMPDDIWDAPDNHVAIGFDDGPSEGSPILYTFLKQNNIPSTHFMIGTNILTGYPLFQQAFSEIKADIAVHTWTHRYMTSLPNEIVLAELAWTMQIIADSTGGRVPRYWRPPSGDSDNRVRAIAKHVLGLIQVNWNQDSEDWRMSTGTITFDEVKNNISNWYAGSHSPGLIILEHELSPNTSQAFIDTYPQVAAHGWQIGSTLRLFGDAYRNAADDDGDVQPMDIIPSGSLSASTTSTSSSSSSVLPTVTAVNQVGQSPTPSGSPAASQASSTSDTNGAITSRLKGIYFPLVIALIYCILSLV